MNADNLMDNYIKGEIERKRLVNDIEKSVASLKKRKTPEEFAEIILKVYQIVNEEGDKC